MDISKLKTLYQILDKSSVEELIVTSPDIHLKICKGDQDKDSLDLLNESEDGDKEVIVTDGSTVAPTNEENVEQEDEGTFDVHSPQVGFFSRFNSKTGKQYVKLRDVVQKGDIIGVVMAMHIEHLVVAEEDGKIRDFLVEEKQPVEYAQPLARLLFLKQGDEQTEEKEIE